MFALLSNLSFGSKLQKYTYNLYWQYITYTSELDYSTDIHFILTVKTHVKVKHTSICAWSPLPVPISNKFGLTTSFDIQQDNVEFWFSHLKYIPILKSLACVVSWEMESQKLLLQFFIFQITNYPNFEFGVSLILKFNETEHYNANISNPYLFYSRPSWINSYWFVERLWIVACCCWWFIGFIIYIYITNDFLCTLIIKHLK